MKKIILAVLFGALAVGTVYAAVGPTEEDYQNLDQLKRKLIRMKREMDSFMKELMTTYPTQGQSLVDVYGQDVRVDVSETDKDVIVKADLPGMDKDRIEVTLQNSKFLKIAGSREIEKKEEAPGMIKHERMQGKFERVLELPVECRSEGISASYTDGVLEIKIPKKEKTKSEEVKIKIQ